MIKHVQDIKYYNMVRNTNHILNKVHKCLSTRKTRFEIKEKALLYVLKRIEKSN